MRTIILVIAVFLLGAGAAVGQGYEVYQHNADGFKIAVPGAPIMTTTTFMSEKGYRLPAHVHTVERGGEHYSITVVDYRPVEEMGKHRAQNCVHKTELACEGNPNTGPGFWRHDVRGALVYASHMFMKRNATLTDFVWANHDRIEGHELQLTNPDGSRTYVYITMHEMRLYITEATIPKGAAPATQFQTSMQLVDKDGEVIRYENYYNNTYHGMGLHPRPKRVTGAPVEPQ
jgi:hypothetical protein